eukprot:scaffold1147_cov126-Cylindrotheca_fusiformis.AAC.9
MSDAENLADGYGVSTLDLFRVLETFNICTVARLASTRVAPVVVNTTKWMWDFVKHQHSVQDARDLVVSVSSDAPTPATVATPTADDASSSSRLWDSYFHMVTAMILVPLIAKSGICTGLQGVSKNVPRHTMVWKIWSSRTLHHAGRQRMALNSLFATRRTSSPRQQSAYIRILCSLKRVEHKVDRMVGNARPR